MLNLWLLYPHHHRRGAATWVLIPIVVTKQLQRLSYGFVETLCRNLDRMFNATRVATTNLARSDRHS
jgi:hypothetical protein